MNLTNPKNNECITSPFATDLDAKDALFAKLTAGEFSRDPSFAQKLVVAFHNGKLSPAMQFWLHKLASPKAPVQTVDIDVSGISALFAKANARLKRPAVILDTTDGIKVKVSLAGKGSKFNGSILVTSPKFGGGYYGRVTEGKFFPSRQCTPTITALLKSFSASPAEVAAKHGHATGCCCFCNRALDTKESLSVGYGPICAEKYDLPWGHIPAAAAAAPATFVIEEPITGTTVGKFTATPAKRDSLVYVGPGFAPVPKSLLNEMAEENARELAIESFCVA